MSKLTLIGSPTCPYVQRVIIALREKRAVFDVVTVDLANKPDWFLAISPAGQVPLLRLEEDGGPPAIIFESMAILDYLEETLPGERLLPADPLLRARQRGWVAFGARVQDDLGRYCGATDGHALAAARAALVVSLRRVEAALGEGPYFGGAHFSLVDAAFAPLFRQIEVLEKLAPGGLLDGLPGMEKWQRALAARPSVRDAVPDNDVVLYVGRLRQLDAELLKAA